MLRCCVARLVVLGSLLLTGACGGAAPPAVPIAPLVWPASPEQARIRYAKSIRGPQDAGIEKSFFGRVTETLFGTSDEYLVRPTGVAEREGVLYVADPGVPAVWILDVPGRRFVKVERLGTVALVSPVAVAPGSRGEVFVADSALGQIFRLDRRGKLVGTITDEALKRPAGLAYEEGTRRIYVADSLAHQISVYGDDGQPLARWGQRGNADGEFNGPTHLGIVAGRTLLVTDALNFRVQAFDRDGRFIWKMGRHGDGSGDFAAPKGIAVDSLGHVYVVDALFDAVQVFDRDGMLLLGFGGRGVGPGQFWLPAGIFIGESDRIYVADAFNQRIQIFEYLHQPGEETTR